MSLSRRNKNILSKDSLVMMTEDKPAIHPTNLLIIMAERNRKARGGKMREARADTERTTTGKEAKMNVTRRTKRDRIVMMAKTTSEAETKRTTTTKTATPEIMTDGTTTKTEIDPAKTKPTTTTETTTKMIKEQRKELQAMIKEQRLPRATTLIDF